MKVQRDNNAEREARLDWMLQENRTAAEATKERADQIRTNARGRIKQAQTYLERARTNHRKRG